MVDGVALLLVFCERCGCGHCSSCAFCFLTATLFTVHYNYIISIIIIIIASAYFLCLL